MLTESWVLPLFFTVIASYMDDAATGKFLFGDSGELFNTALQYASWRTPIPKVLKFFQG